MSTRGKTTCKPSVIAGSIAKTIVFRRLSSLFSLFFPPFFCLGPRVMLKRDSRDFPPGLPDVFVFFLPWFFDYCFCCQDFFLLYYLVAVYLGKLGELLSTDGKAVIFCSSILPPLSNYGHPSWQKRDYVHISDALVVPTVERLRLHNRGLVRITTHLFFIQTPFILKLPNIWKSSFFFPLLSENGSGAILAAYICSRLFLLRTGQGGSCPSSLFFLVNLRDESVFLI